MILHIILHDVMLYYSIVQYMILPAMRARGGVLRFSGSLHLQIYLIINNNSNNSSNSNNDSHGNGNY